MSRSGSNTTTAAAVSPSLLWTHCSFVPATTWALVMTYPSATTNPLPWFRKPW